MNTELRRKVLSCFKKLHRTRMLVFRGDTSALSVVREKINEEFGKNKTVTDTKKIDDLINLGIETEEVLRTSLIQAVSKDDNTFQLNIREEVTRVDDKIYIPIPDNMIGQSSKNKKCSSDS